MLVQQEFKPQGNFDEFLQKKNRFLHVRFAGPTSRSPQLLIHCKEETGSPKAIHVSSFLGCSSDGRRWKERYRTLKIRFPPLYSDPHSRS
jgi:hypothetical protein